MFESPDGHWRAGLVLAGEIRFGPCYYALQLNGRTLADRIFGEPLVWSEDSRHLVVQEWLTIDYGTGPRTRAVLIRPQEGRCAALAVVEKGFADQFRFGADVLRYCEVLPGRGEAIQREVALSAVKPWTRCQWAQSATP